MSNENETIKKLSISEENLKEMFEFDHSFIIEYQKDGEEFVDEVSLNAGEPLDYKSLEDKYGSSYKICGPIFDPEDFDHTMESIKEGIEQRKFQKKTESAVTAINKQTQPPASDRQLETAQKTGYVQGVCESVLAFNNDENRKIMTEATMSFLSKKLLSEMNVTKDMAQKFASPETYKALEKCVFAPKQEQKLEQTQSQGFKM
jgi:hypothetical protein